MTHFECVKWESGFCLLVMERSRYIAPVQGGRGRCRIRSSGMTSMRWAWITRSNCVQNQRTSLSCRAGKGKYIYVTHASAAGQAQQLFQIYCHAQYSWLHEIISSGETPFCSIEWLFLCYLLEAYSDASKAKAEHMTSVVRACWWKTKERRAIRGYLAIMSHPRRVSIALPRTRSGCTYSLPSPITL